MKGPVVYSEPHCDMCQHICMYVIAGIGIRIIATNKTPQMDPQGILAGFVPDPRGKVSQLRFF